MADQSLLGKKFGKLKVIEFHHQKPREHAYWQCKCSCGTKIIVRENTLKTQTRACQSCANTTHGMTKHPVYAVYRAMMLRCYNSNHKSYKDYGGRGISVCRLWAVGDGFRSGFECFLADMGVRPREKFQLDRRDNDGNYSKDNCRWVARRVQVNNRRVTRVVKFIGINMPLTLACRNAGVKITHVNNQMYTYKKEAQVAFDHVLLKAAVKRSDSNR